MSNSHRETCAECDKPLGATRPVCYTCGGTSDRGPRVTNRLWQALSGVGK